LGALHRVARDQAGQARIPPRVGEGGEHRHLGNVSETYDRVSDLLSHAALRLFFGSRLFFRASIRSMTSAPFSFCFSGAVISSVSPAFTFSFTRFRMSSR